MDIPALDLQTLDQLQPETLPRRLAAHLSTAIIEGGLQPGSRLPSFGRLAERFGVSRPVVREAVHILATQGLVEVRHGRVSTVAADNGPSLVDGLALSVRRRGGSFRELSEVRRTLRARPPPSRPSDARTRTWRGCGACWGTCGGAWRRPEQTTWRRTWGSTRR